MKIIVNSAVLEKALEALEDTADSVRYTDEQDDVGNFACCHKLTYKGHAKDCPVILSIDALRAALQSAENAEPVAWQVTRNLADDPYNRIPWLTSSKPLEVQPGTSVVPLYATPVASSEGVKPWPGLVVQDLGFSRINGKNIPTVVLAFAEEDWATRDAFTEAMEGASHAQTKRI